MAQILSGVLTCSRNFCYSPKTDGRTRHKNSTIRSHPPNGAGGRTISAASHTLFILQLAFYNPPLPLHEEAAMTVATTIKRRATSRSAWVLPKEESCIAPEEIWSNKGAAIS
jgi:hypothetical protein